MSMNNGTKMTKNDFNNNLKAQQKEISGGEDFSKYFKEQPTEMNKEELMINKIKPENKDADDEPIYAISDFEGRYDYYIRFFTDIGFLDKKKLYDAVEGKIKLSKKQKKEKSEELEMLKILFTKSPEEWFEKIIKHCNFFGTDMSVKVPGTGNVYKTNIERLNFLKTYFTEDVLKNAINKNFKGKIVINGDLYSSRVNDLFGEEKKEIVLINKLCFNLFDAIKKDNNVKDHLILVAGNHDVYHMDYADGQYYNSRYDDILKNIKNSTLPFLTKWFKVKTKDDKMLIFKHSPYLKELKGVSTDLSEIINNKKNCQGVGMDKIIKSNKDNNKNSHHTWQYYFYNGFDQQNTFNSAKYINNNVKKLLDGNKAKLVVGHCHAGGKIKDGCICIDDDGKYKYRVFHFNKKKDISNDKNKTESTKYREDIYFDDIQDKIMPSMSANNLNYNNNNHLYPQGYIKRQNPNITNEEFQQILQNNEKQLPPNFDKDDIIKFRVENKQTQPANNETELRKDKNNILNNDPNHQSRDNNEYYCGNPIFKIMDHVNNDSGQQNDNNKTEQKQNDNNKTEQKQDDNNNTEQNKKNISLYTFDFTNTATFNQQQPQNKKVSCEMVKNCLSSMGECFNCKCG